MNSDSAEADFPQSETPLAGFVRDRGLKKGWLAEKLGIPASSLTRLLQGKRDLSLDEAVVLADLLGVDVRDLSPRGAQ